MQWSIMLTRQGSAEGQVDKDGGEDKEETPPENGNSFSVRGRRRL